MTLRTDPVALAPERLLVFEVRGSLNSFAAAVQKVPGLELIDEDELAADEADDKPVAYLMVPDIRALRELLGFWRKWVRGELVHGETPWKDVFERLRDLRTWGPQDRVTALDVDAITEAISGLKDDDPVRLEVELVYRDDERQANTQERETLDMISSKNGRLVFRSRIEEIGYHALLIELPVSEVRDVADRSYGGIAWVDAIMHVRPQSMATSIELTDGVASGPSETVDDLDEPILALLDGVPMSGHPLLAKNIMVDDQFELEAGAQLAGRKHGTAMASLVIHGDRNKREPTLYRRIHVVPVLGSGDNFPDDRLIVDVIYRAVLNMRDGDEPTAPTVLIVNISLGNRRRPFHGQMSPWARLLDRLSFRFGILFLVSAGNKGEPFAVPAYGTSIAVEGSPADERAAGVLAAVGSTIGDRRLLSPAETVNGITIGARNEDAVPNADRVAARVNVDPYLDLLFCNPSSALGPGFGLSVKPDVLMPGARGNLRVVGRDSHITVMPAAPSRSAGLRVASPPYGGFENAEAYTGGTSAAAALASRTCHRIHDALEEEYGDLFLRLPHIQRAVILKALFVHPARWPDAAATLIRNVIGPPEGKFHSRQKDNIRRFLGFGVVDGDDAVACASDRATFWAGGMLQADTVASISVPVPVAMSGKARPHAMSATLAWFTPTSPGRKLYRSVRLQLLEPAELSALAISSTPNQPDLNQTKRGTIFTRYWTGQKAPIIRQDMSIQIVVQRDPDQLVQTDESIPFGLAVTLAMPGVEEIYEQVSVRLRPRTRVR
jgi:hypothetical protein